MTKKEILQKLMAIKAININTTQLYTWASGIKSPIYIDNRLIMSYPDLRTAIAEEFVNLIQEKFGDYKVTTIFGTATAGIPHAMLVANLMQLPMGYVRGSKKDHGKQNQIEGVYQKGDQVIVIEDLISTGGSVLDVVASLQATGVKVLGVLAIFSYQLPKALNNFKKMNLNYYALTDLDELVNPDNALLTSSEQKIILNFKEQLNNK
ncbi:orotate phosphoribosyltransferase [Spiroplasma eriocheiris]|uniref:Orotate phosphoribosyltransferase n=1 Tax=Spiroplasma eriocheiris TaxID=315358 RepID=A0A0H3XH96_9MOLU|nr:orotate phosphoribosyltransferase [Spiroplasma eriocheiris]AHF57551.1 orotate phosphoribosyltransferase [Spiroplasma eriocheiris CCTCC M 207170]AKM54008.1 orotate phosphoribosyltransferase [Spiroplasma eriocheiris]